MRLIAGLLASALALGFATTSNAAELPDRIKKAGKIVVATMPNYAPITFKDPATNKLTGFDIDLGEALAKELGVGIEWQEIAFAQMDRLVKQGLVRPGDTVEVVWRINEILPIPDPAFGDRKPLTGTNLVATVSGPQQALYEVHALDAPGTFGIHFTAGATGLYRVELNRADGRPGLKTEFALGVGVPMPGLERVGKQVRPGEDEIELTTW